ncbi:Plastid-targeted protein 2 [Heracleum sosnowskyi]|uniref:Plastid-targeted protein 2 n=1 Tax=Heracleum sosnowskyi TaxID=360622 RepID=A0AAD8JN56_9APIA|nr:Plastid-targeted protein 2 [Heracleum sosnowskyi]
MPLPRYQTLVFNPMSEIRVGRHGNNSLCSTWQHDSKMKRSFVVYSSIPPEPLIPSGGLPGGLPGSWKNWLLGMVVTVLIPLLTNKWGALLKWTRKNEEQIESAVQTVEDIVEAVEDVAEKVEKFTEDIIEDLPEGKFKTALGRIEHVAEEIAKDAKQIDNAIDKFQEVEDEVQAYIEEKQSNKAAEKDRDGKHAD